MFGSISEIYDLVLAAFPWLVVELWLVDMMFGGVYAAASKEALGTNLSHSMASYATCTLL